jgi:hypothetical protein
MERANYIEAGYILDALHRQFPTSKYTQPVQFKIQSEKNRLVVRVYNAATEAYELFSFDSKQAIPSDTLDFSFL